jgi:Flp pilus assembly pilin Flp
MTKRITMIKQRYATLLGRLRSFAGDTRGVTAIEYAIMASLVSVALALVVFGVGGGPVTQAYQSVVQGFETLLGG